MTTLQLESLTHYLNYQLTRRAAELWGLVVAVVSLPTLLDEHSDVPAG